MATLKQVEANRKNAQKSTGPVTEQGKAVVAKNAIRHGILSTHVFIEEEERDVYEEFRTDMLRSLAPRGDFENFLADRAISAAWRLRRIVHIETLMLQKEKSEYFGDDSYRGAFVGGAATNMAILSRYERSLENALYRAVKELRSLQSEDEIEVLEVVR